MKNLTTPSGKPFRYFECPGGEIVIYPSDEEGQPQSEAALAITPYTVNLVSGAIRDHGRILMGASRDKPPKALLENF